MASGSQMCNGNMALFPAPPMNISPSASGIMVAPPFSSAISSGWKVLMHTPALTSQQMRYLLAEARDGTPFPALESMKEHLLAQAEPEKALVAETGVKSESRDMASGKEALAEQTGLDGTQKINQNKEME